MYPEINWFERKFSLAFSVERYPYVVERLRGTPARLEERVRPLPAEILTRRDGEDWSIQEHAGHLWDLESLWTGRIEDFLAAVDTLRPADLQNKKTYEANHNANSIDSILESFRTDRQHMVGQLDQLDKANAGRTALHPRLNQPMRVVDLVYFVAEHDDHHLAQITALIRKFS